MEIDVDIINDMFNEIVKLCKCGINKNDSSKIK